MMMLSQKLEKSKYRQIQSSKLTLLPSTIISKQSISQKEVILDIFYILLGMPGRVLSRKSHSQQWQLSEKFEMIHLGSESLKNSITEALKVCNETQYVENEAKKLYRRSANAIVKSFCEAVFDNLHETKKYYESIFSSFNSLSQETLDKVTLLSLSKIFSQRTHMLSFLIRCLNICSIQFENKAQVVNLLDKIWEIEQDLLPFPEINETSLVRIFKRTLRIFFNNIKEWLKVIEIPATMDFFISLPIGKKGELSDMFLYQNVEIEPLKLPKIIENEAKSILEVGKTIRFIKLYYKNYEKQKLMNYLNIDEQFKSLEDLLEFEQFSTFKRVKVEKISINDRLRNRKKERVAVAKPIPEQNPYQIFGKGEEKYFNVKWIQKRQKIQQDQKSVEEVEKVRFGFLFNLRCQLFQILERINKKCLHFFRDPFDTLMTNQKNRIQTSLSHTLIGIKKFMLLEQGDFVEQFFNAAEDILQKQRGNVSHSKIYSCLNEAIESSSAKSLPKQILDNLHFDFIKIPDERRALTSRFWFWFSFHYRQDSPINYIFTVQILQKLKDVCNLILKLKIGQTVLTQLWSLDKQVNVIDWSQQRIVKKTKFLRNSLTTYINSCLSYVLNKIEEIWREYIERIGQSSTIFAIASQTQQVVNKIRAISNEDKIFYNGVMYGVKLIDQLDRLKKNLIEPTIVVQIKDIENMEFQFHSAVEYVMKIPQLNEMINYNEFFNQLH